MLDEPTNGLDAAGIADIRELVRGLREEGLTVILASHLLDEVEKVCTHVAILKQGTVLLSGAVEEVLRSEDTLVLQAADMLALEKVVQSFPGVGRRATARWNAADECDGDRSGRAEQALLCGRGNAHPPGAA